MAEKARTMPGPRGRGPRPKLDHPGQTLGRVLKYVGRKYWLHLIFVVVSIFVSVFAMVQGTLFTKTLIDSYILPLVQQVQAGQTADFTGLMHAITRVALFYACGVIASFVQSRVMIYVTQGTLRDLRQDLFAHMEKLPIRYFDTHAHGDIMSIYTNDIDTLRQMISQSLPQLLNCTINVVSVFVSMLVLGLSAVAYYLLYKLPYALSLWMSAWKLLAVLYAAALLAGFAAVFLLRRKKGVVRVGRQNARLLDAKFNYLPVFAALAFVTLVFAACILLGTHYFYYAVFATAVVLVGYGVYFILLLI